MPRMATRRAPGACHITSRNPFPHRVAIPCALAAAIIAGCAQTQKRNTTGIQPGPAIDAYVAAQSAALRQQAERTEQARNATSIRPSTLRLSAGPAASAEGSAPVAGAANISRQAFATLGMLMPEDAAASQPVGKEAAPPAGKDGSPAAVAGAPPGYWHRDVWHQMGAESLSLLNRDLLKAYKYSFWDVPNMIVLTATMGASIAIRETGVDATIANRCDGSNEFGSLDETVQIIGNPITHFSLAGILWLGSTVTHDFKQHEFSRALGQALIVNGLTTEVLKLSTNTTAPDGDNHAWPSGHTSSAFTAAAVANEYYGPWVGLPSFALAGLVGYQRLDSQVHDFSDVVFGAMLGYVVGTSVAKGDKAEFPEVFGMKVIPFADPQTGAAGLALWKRF